MPKRRTASAALLCALPALLLAACESAPPAPKDHQAPASAAQALATGAELPGRYERVLPWGEGEDALTLYRGGYQDPVRGPNAVAVLPSGAVLILDQLAERVVAVGDEGAPVKVAEAPVDALDLVAGPDGSFAVYSKVRARAWLHDAAGERLGELAVPRSFMFVQRLSLGPERSLTVHTDNQDRIALGSPGAEVPERTARRARRYGAAELPDGRGVFVHADGGHARLLVLEQPDRERDRPTLAGQHDLPGEVTAARIVGTYGTTTCLRLEQVESTPAIAVDRRALCLDAESGQVLLDEALPEPGLYGPQSELAMAGRRMAFIHPSDAGLRIVGWRVPRAETEEVER